MNSKTCPVCNCAKPFSEFYRDSRAADGHRGQCKVCSKAAAAAWAKSQPERMSAYHSKWRATHQESTSKSAALWRKRNPEAVIAQRVKRRKEKPEECALAAAKWKKENPKRNAEHTARWKRKHPAKVNVANAARRASENGATPEWANQFFISEAYDLAQRRTNATGFRWHVDHIVPLKSKLVCGLHTEHNLQVIPATQNCSKSNRRWPDMS